VPLTIAQGTPTVRSFAYEGPQLIVPPAEPRPDPEVPATPLATTTSLSCSSTESVFGQPVTLAIHVMTDGSAVPTGMVQLRDGPTVLAFLILVDGTATYRTDALAGGTHNLVAEYLGGAGFLPSISASMTSTVRIGGVAVTSPEQGPAVLMIGGSAGHDRIRITTGPAGRLVRVVVRGADGRRLFARRFDARKLSALEVFEGTGRDTIRVRGNFRVPVVLRGRTGSRVLHPGSAGRAAAPNHSAWLR
jgi:hypothetical protein